MTERVLHYSGSMAFVRELAVVSRKATFAEKSGTFALDLLSGFVRKRGTWLKEELKCIIHEYEGT